ncbi:type III secretion inner membrane ring lipoprotein SctJ [Stenotrophomonas indicatrix]|uniref:type III secretion system inner membrane ring lipoprotein SctJ n=1 Tax=Stenotrophomonas indicatrix TaxID=2045451 RepID=UPI00300865BD
MLASYRLAISFLLCLIVTGCAKSELLQALDERQANEVVAVMLRHNIAATKLQQGKAGFAVQVGQKDLAEAIDLVQVNALPSPPRTQIAGQFPADAMVSTPLGERARLLSAIEQRLEESLATLDGVQTARVHVSYDAAPADGGLQQRKPAPMHLAALLVHHQGVDEQVLVQSVKRLLRNAFVDVAYDNISVVLTPASATRVLGVTAAEGRGWAWLILPVAFLLLLLGTIVTIRRGGKFSLMALRRRWRRRKLLNASAT